MKRIKTYFSIYILTLLLYIVLNNNMLVDTLTFISFFITSLIFIFSREEMPKASKIKIPEVFVYQQVRINLFGIIMSIGLALASFIFMLSSFNKSIRLGVIVLILWPLMIACSYYTLLYYSRLKERNLISEYIKSNISGKYNELDYAIALLVKINEGKLVSFKSSFEQLKRDKNLSHVNIPFLHETLSLFYQYLQSTDYSPLPSEIEEINRQ